MNNYQQILSWVAQALNQQPIHFILTLCYTSLSCYASPHSCEFVRFKFFGSHLKIDRHSNIVSTPKS